MPDRDAFKRLFRNARREAAFVLTVWFLALVWTVGYCYVRGYDHPPDSWPVRAGLTTGAADTSLMLGLPGWVMFGILAPWLVCTAITIFFCLFIMTDDELGAEAGEETRHGH